MRIFIYEYTCSGGMAGEAEADSLKAEGSAMLAAVLEDFGRLTGAKAFTILEDKRREGQYPALTRPSAFVYRTVQAGQEEATFRDAARLADCTVVIAPEFDDILLTRCRWVEEAGGRLLGPSCAAIDLTADKLALAQHLADRGVPTPRCQPFLPGQFRPNLQLPLICKPRYGAGSQATFLIRHPDELAASAAQARAEGWQGETLLQPFVPGTAASVAFLIGPNQRLPLLPAAQQLSEDGRFRYLGGSVPLPPELGQRAVKLAGLALATVDGLRGYIGVDLVLGAAPDGSQDCVIEINPRLTTSYVGLRVLARTNLAEAMLRIVAGEGVTLSWRSGAVRFQSDGKVTACGAG